MGKCAKNVGDGVRAGGIPLVNPPKGYAKDYGKPLEDVGFKKIADQDNPNGYTPKPGDIAIMPNYPTGKPFGHIAMNTNGTDDGWGSDFAQRDMFGGQGYRDAGKYDIYKNPNW